MKANRKKKIKNIIPEIEIQSYIRHVEFDFRHSLVLLLGRMGFQGEMLKVSVESEKVRNELNNKNVVMVLP